MKGTQARIIRPSQITPLDAFLNRRELLAGAMATGALSAAAHKVQAAPAAPPPDPHLAFTRNARYSVKEAPTSFQDITHYNNFYEFGTGKEDPAHNAHTLRPKPWSVTVGGECAVRGTFAFDDLIKGLPLEERIYRFRCVEAWSMVIPWLGFQLSGLIQKLKPNSNAKYVQLVTLMDPKQMPGERDDVLQWPYVEGLRLDEAMNPLALIAIGLYGQVLPNQNGAPLRLVTPWKYGFKGVKSIVKINFVATQPATTWAISAPNEYGFYANVNPHVDHPRWSQASERPIGKGLFAARQPTLLFNGYENEVGYLYKGMDLRRNF
ncbi:MAG TPA: protein-methionine-sulfoxide reductase catalytic subunit MsrP [Steroidobacteraceae bacterium]|jgi:sulfoxide reductase catalytic subunit YedY|nr:protein-methionine-sulfoxide reductase catalytic subunit MsrP [Steroidobacteraceae bacterium]